MPELQTNPKVDKLLQKEEVWHEEFMLLRAIILNCGLTEELKWGQPCYMSDGGNVVLIHGFKFYCALLFMKGALMKDPLGILVQQTQNVQSARQIRFLNSGEIRRLTPVVQDYVLEAVELQKNGERLAKRTTAEFAVPDAFRSRLDSDPSLKAAFDALTPGRQRGYLLCFSSAKQVKTCVARVEKSLPLIFSGKGLDD